MGKNEFAKSVLEKYGALTVDMVEAFRRDNVEYVAYASEKAVLIKHKAGILYMLWAKDVEEGVKAINADIDNMKMCVCHGEAAIEAISKATDFEIGKRCIQYCNYSGQPMKLSGVCDIVPLEREDISFVMEHYGTESDKHIIRNIESGTIFKAVVDGENAGFIGMHSDGSTGMLTVVPKFRRRGIGTELETYMYNFELSKGWVSYGQVYYDNEASIQLQIGIGLSVSDGYISWTFEKDED